MEILEEQAAGIPVNAVADLLKQILGIESDTVKRLAKIEAKVDRLLETPYKAAIEQTESAAVPGISEDERKRRLDIARDRLIDAIAAAGNDLTSRCAAEVALASLHYLRQQHGDAIHYAVRAYRTSSDAVAEACDEANVFRLGRVPILKASWYKSWLTYDLDFKAINSIFRKQKLLLCFGLSDRCSEVREIAAHIGATANDIPKMILMEDPWKGPPYAASADRVPQGHPIIWEKEN